MKCLDDLLDKVIEQTDLENRIDAINYLLKNGINELDLNEDEVKSVALIYRDSPSLRTILG